MKQNIHPYRTAALLLFVMLAAACTKEDDFAALPDKGTATAAPLTITVTDGAYAPAETPDNDNSPATRAVERGYGTEFTKGDCIGLYTVEQDASGKRQFLHKNLCLIHDGTGWTRSDGSKLTHEPPTGGEILYFAYYPYQNDMAGKVNILAMDDIGVSTTQARYFFRPLIKDWSPADDQSTYEAYTASDLMTAKGKVTKRTDGTDGSVLSFTMEHQMALAIIRLPATKYTYAETNDGRVTEKSYRLYSGLDSDAWLANDNTYRRIMQWHPTDNTVIAASYYNSSFERRRFIGTIKANSPGKYFLFTVDDGGETVVKRRLSIGDFYMKDGTILPGDAFPSGLPAKVQADCIGIVFSTIDPTPYEPLLRRHHPACNHGTVIALKNAHNEVVWSNRTNIAVNDWTNSDSRGEDKVDIKLHANNGYAPTYALRLYNKAHTADSEIVAVAEVDRYGETTPAPANSSGWYLPGMELGNIEAHQNINASFQKAGGEALNQNQNYWTSIERTDSYALAITPAITWAEGWKGNSYPIRAMLAF